MLHRAAKFFVDRESELERFHRMLSGESDARILLITDESETGKTSFLARLFEACDQGTPPVPVASVNFDRRLTDNEIDYIGVALAISRHLGEACTPHICACVASGFRRGPLVSGGAGESGGVDFGEAGTFDQAEVSAAGRDSFGDISINYTEAAPTPQQLAQHRAAMGRALRDDLAKLAETYDRVVLLMDTFEYADADTRAWLEHWLLEPMRRELAHVLLIVAGKPPCRPFFDRPSPWSRLIDAIERFAPLQSHHVRTYCQRCGLAISDTEMPLLVDIVQEGGPVELARIGDLLRRRRGARQWA
jgi:hypothetical protein